LLKLREVFQDLFLDGSPIARVSNITKLVTLLACLIKKWK